MIIEYCCNDLKNLLTYNGPIVIKNEDLSIDALGYHEVYRDDTPLRLKLKFCPFCGKELTTSSTDNNNIKE